jgi:hypothetical protein
VFFIDQIGTRELELLLKAAPDAPRNYNANRFIDGLIPLAQQSPREVAQVLLLLLESYHPDFDFEDKIRSLIIELSQHPDARANAVRCVEAARHLVGYTELYAQLKASTEAFPKAQSTEPHAINADGDRSNPRAPVSFSS